MRFSKWLALLLCLCLSASAVFAALAEEQEEVLYQAEESDDIEEEADDWELDLGAADGELDIGSNAVADEPQADLPDDYDGEQAVSAPALGLTYARVTKASAPVYFDVDAVETIARLAKGEVVLVIEDYGDMAAISMNVSGRLVEGFMKPGHIAGLSAKEAGEYQAQAAASGKVALYDSDIDWPLGALSSKSDTGDLSLMANYKEYDNSTPFILNGKSIKASDYPTTGPHNCWAWAQKVYKKAWGVNFGSDFAGTASKGYNLIRNFKDSERELTPDNLKYIITHAVPGATLRVQECSLSCSGINGDGCSKHNKHSLIIAEIREDGLVTMDDQGYGPHTRFYTWEGFCKSWAKWKYVKYVKWPNAPALDPPNSVDGYRVGSVSETYKVRATASKGAVVYSKPEKGEALATLAYPATFTASKKSVSAISGYTWVYGKTEAGVTGWLALTDAVANTKDAIKVTGVALSQTKLVLVKGGTATLQAAIAPIDATNQSVSWASSDTSVATVNGGSVVGVSGGTATITVTTADGSKQATCAVRVVAADATKTLKSTGSNGTVKLCLGQKLQLVPKFATKKGWKVKKVSSSKKKVASVDKDGIVTANAAGKATITVKTKNGKSARVTVKVIDPNAPTKVVLNKSGTIAMKKGSTLKLQTKLSPSTATTTLTWKSSKPKVVYVDGEGNLYALKKGKCVIGVKTANGKYDTVKVIVG